MLASLLLTGACGAEERGEDGVTTKERSDLDNAAAMLDGNEIVDTSADSLVLEENGAGAAAAGNAAAPVPPASDPQTGNGVAPR